MWLINSITSVHYNQVRVVTSACTRQSSSRTSSRQNLWLSEFCNLFWSLVSALLLGFNFIELENVMIGEKTFWHLMLFAEFFPLTWNTWKKEKWGVFKVWKLCKACSQKFFSHHRLQYLTFAWFLKKEKKTDLMFGAATAISNCTWHLTVVSFSSPLSSLLETGCHDSQSVVQVNALLALRSLSKQENLKQVDSHC